MNPAAPVRASLMVTCLGDVLYPEIGVRIVRLLRRLGVAVDFPPGQTCCGLPLFNSGYRAEAAAVAQRTVPLFGDAEHVVVPSGSCAWMVLVGAIASQRGARRLVTWHPDALGADLGGPLAGHDLHVDVMPGEPTNGGRADLRDRIAAAEIGLTGVDVAIAETGSLVLLSGVGRPRSTALLPVCHVAVFDRTALVESLQQMGLVLEAWHEGTVPAERGAAIRVITGPSRTADIELTLTRGVHGPGEVHTIFVDRPWHG